MNADGSHGEWRYARVHNTNEIRRSLTASPTAGLPIVSG